MCNKHSNIEDIQELIIINKNGMFFGHKSKISTLYIKIKEYYQDRFSIISELIMKYFIINILTLAMSKRQSQQKFKKTQKIIIKIRKSHLSKIIQFFPINIPSSHIT